MNRSLIILIVTIASILSFFVGRGYQFKMDESLVNRVIENTSQCDMEAPGMPNGVIEVDCFTPESYYLLNNYFFSNFLSDSNLVKYRLNNVFDR